MQFFCRPLLLSIDKELKGLGHLLFAGLFDDEHSFTIVDNNNGSCTFIEAERFRGMLVFLFKKQLNQNTKKGFELMNE